MRIALIQTGSPTGEDATARRARVGRTMADLPTGIDLIVLPELWAVGFNHFDDYATEAEDLTGPTVRLCAETARARRAWVLAGSIVERTDAGRLRNTAV